MPAFYVPNHQSFLDIHTLLILERSFEFISKMGIVVIPIVRLVMFLKGLIPLRRVDSWSQLVLVLLCSVFCLQSLIGKFQCSLVVFIKETCRHKSYC